MMNSVSDVLNKLSICISKFNLSVSQIQALMRAIKIYEETNDRMMLLNTASDDPQVKKALDDYMNKHGDYRIGEYQS
ncbi:hypothetical protein KBA63_05720 [Candidatus Woesebacteria bacterium]|nr:hypothetical protein [Candidatus Woesebacteria bacterium]